MQEAETEDPVLPRKLDLLSHYVSQTEIVETQLARKMRLILPQIARNRHYDLVPLVSFRATGIEMRYVKGRPRGVATKCADERPGNCLPGSILSSCSGAGPRAGVG